MPEAQDLVREGEPDGDWTLWCESVPEPPAPDLLALQSWVMMERGPDYLEQNFWRLYKQRERRAEAADA